MCYNGFIGNKSEYYWSNKTLLDILSNPAYTGAVVGNKTKKVSPKSKKKIKVPYEQWIVVENMHEPIVSKEIFENVQRIRTQNKQHYASKMSENRFENIFSRIIRCPKDKNLICRKIDCRGNDVDIENRKYCCSDKCPYKTEECKNVYLRAENLYKIVLNDINKYTNSFLENAEDYKLLEEKIEETTNLNTSIIETEKAKLDKRLNEINQLKESRREGQIDLIKCKKGIYNIAQNQSFVQKGIGVKYKNSDSSPTQ